MPDLAAGLTDLFASCDRRGSARPSVCLRRRLAQEVATATEPVTVAYLYEFAVTFIDGADDEVMRGASE